MLAPVLSENVVLLVVKLRDGFKECNVRCFDLAARESTIKYCMSKMLLANCTRDARGAMLPGCILFYHRTAPLYTVSQSLLILVLVIVTTRSHVLGKWQIAQLGSVC